MPEFVRVCPVCGQQSAKNLYRPKASIGMVARCTHCSMVYVKTIEDAHALIFDGPVLDEGMSRDTLTSSDLSAVSAAWEFRSCNEKEAELACLRLNAKRALDRIELLVEKHPGVRILDFGCGFGYFLAAARERGWDAYGLEPLTASAVYARATFGVKVVTDTLHEDTFPDQFFDVVTAFQVFEHLPDPGECLRLLGNALKTGGILLVEVPRFDTWSMRLLGPRHRHYVQDHLNFYTRRTLCLHQEQHGYEVLECRHSPRTMSVHHLYTCWIARRLPGGLFRAGEKALKGLGLWQRNLRVDIGDILTVIGRKS